MDNILKFPSRIELNYSDLKHLELNSNIFHRGINPDKAVAYGAAVHANVLSGEQDTGEFNFDQDFPVQTNW